MNYFTSTTTMQGHLAQAVDNILSWQGFDNTKDLEENVRQYLFRNIRMLGSPESYIELLRGHYARCPIYDLYNGKRIKGVDRWTGEAGAVAEKFIRQLAETVKQVYEQDMREEKIKN